MESFTFLTVCLWLILKFFLDDQNPTIPTENCVKMSLPYFPSEGSHCVHYRADITREENTRGFVFSDSEGGEGTEDGKRHSLVSSTELSEGTVRHK